MLAKYVWSSLFNATNKQKQTAISGNMRVPIGDSQFTLANFCFFFSIFLPLLSLLVLLSDCLSPTYLFIICQLLFPEVSINTKSVETLGHKWYHTVVITLWHAMSQKLRQVALRLCLLYLNALLYSIAHAPPAYLAFPICSTCGIWVFSLL